MHHEGGTVAAAEAPHASDIAAGLTMPTAASPTLTGKPLVPDGGWRDGQAVLHVIDGTSAHPAPSAYSDTTLYYVTDHTYWDQQGHYLGYSDADRYITGVTINSAAYAYDAATGDPRILFTTQYGNFSAPAPTASHPFPNLGTALQNQPVPSALSDAHAAAVGANNPSVYRVSGVQVTNAAPASSPPATCMDPCYRITLPGGMWAGYITVQPNGIVFTAPNGYLMSVTRASLAYNVSNGTVDPQPRMMIATRQSDGQAHANVFSFDVTTAGHVGNPLADALYAQLYEPDFGMAGSALPTGPDLDDTAAADAAAPAAASDSIYDTSFTAGTAERNAIVKAGIPADQVKLEDRYTDLTLTPPSDGSTRPTSAELPSNLIPVDYNDRKSVLQNGFSYYSFDTSVDPKTPHWFASTDEVMASKVLAQGYLKYGPHDFRPVLVGQAADGSMGFVDATNPSSEAIFTAALNRLQGNRAWESPSTDTTPLADSSIVDLSGHQPPDNAVTNENPLTFAPDGEPMVRFALGRYQYMLSASATGAGGDTASGSPVKVFLGQNASGDVYLFRPTDGHVAPVVGQLYDRVGQQLVDAGAAAHPVNENGYSDAVTTLRYAAARGTAPQVFGKLITAMNGQSVVYTGKAFDLPTGERKNLLPEEAADLLDINKLDAATKDGLTSPEFLKAKSTAYQWALVAGSPAEPGTPSAIVAASGSFVPSTVPSYVDPDVADDGHLNAQSGVAAAWRAVGWIVGEASLYQAAGITDPNAVPDTPLGYTEDQLIKLLQHEYRVSEPGACAILINSFRMLGIDNTSYRDATDAGDLGRASTIQNIRAVLSSDRNALSHPQNDNDWTAFYRAAGYTADPLSLKGLTYVRSSVSNLSDREGRNALAALTPVATWLRYRLAQQASLSMWSQLPVWSGSSDTERAPLDQALQDIMQVLSAVDPALAEIVTANNTSAQAAEKMADVGNVTWSQLPDEDRQDAEKVVTYHIMSATRLFFRNLTFADPALVLSTLAVRNAAFFKEFDGLLKDPYFNIPLNDTDAFARWMHLYIHQKPPTSIPLIGPLLVETGLLQNVCAILAIVATAMAYSGQPLDTLGKEEVADTVFQVFAGATHFPKVAALLRITSFKKAATQIAKSFGLAGSSPSMTLRRVRMSDKTRMKQAAAQIYIVAMRNLDSGKEVLADADIDEVNHYFGFETTGAEYEQMRSGLVQSYKDAFIEGAFKDQALTQALSALAEKQHASNDLPLADMFSLAETQTTPSGSSDRQAAIENELVPDGDETNKTEIEQLRDHADDSGGHGSDEPWWGSQSDARRRSAEVTEHDSGSSTETETLPQYEAEQSPNPTDPPVDGTVTAKELDVADHPAPPDTDPGATEEKEKDQIRQAMSDGMDDIADEPSEQVVLDRTKQSPQVMADATDATYKVLHSAGLSRSQSLQTMRIIGFTLQLVELASDWGLTIVSLMTDIAGLKSDYPAVRLQSRVDMASDVLLAIACLLELVGAIAPFAALLIMVVLAIFGWMIGHIILAKADPTPPILIDWIKPFRDYGFLTGDTCAPGINVCADSVQRIQNWNDPGEALGKKSKFDGQPIRPQNPFSTISASGWTMNSETRAAGVLYNVATKKCLGANGTLTLVDCNSVATLQDGPARDAKDPNLLQGVLPRPAVNGPTKMVVGIGGDTTWIGNTANRTCLRADGARNQYLQAEWGACSWTDVNPEPPAEPADATCSPTDSRSFTNCLAFTDPGVFFIDRSADTSVVSLVHAGVCLDENNATVTMSTCVAGDAGQQWIYGGYLSQIVRGPNG